MVHDNTTAIPLSINLGSGKSYRPDALNIDINGYWEPDLVADLSQPGALDETYQSKRFGQITIPRDYFAQIEASDVLEHVPNLVCMMKTCLDILQVGGEFKIGVPYDLSHGAWQDPTHVRAFNEKSWLYYTDWFWYLGWQEARFDQTSNVVVLSAYGLELQAQGMPLGRLIMQPRAVDSMNVVLQKRLLTDAEKAFVANFLRRDPR